MPFEIEQIAEVVGGADGRSDSPVRGVEPDEVGVVGIRVVRSEVSGDIGGRWPDEHRVEALAVVVVPLLPHDVPLQMYDHHIASPHSTPPRPTAPRRAGHAPSCPACAYAPDRLARV